MSHYVQIVEPAARASALRFILPGGGALSHQDHRFLDSFLTLLGAALATADTFEARLRFGRFIGMVSAEEDTFFVRAFEALGVTEDRRAADPDTGNGAHRDSLTSSVSR